MTFCLPNATMRKLGDKCKALLKCNQSRLRHLLAVIGIMNFSKPAIRVAPIFFRSLQYAANHALKIHKGNYYAHLTLSPASKTDMEWWISEAHHHSSGDRHSHLNRCISPRMGGSLRIQSSTWPLVTRGEDDHINFLELQAAFFGIKLYASQTHASLSRWTTIQQFSSWTNARGTHSPTLNSLTILALKHAMQKNILITASALAVPIEQVLRVADWSNTTAFHKFYMSTCPPREVHVYHTFSDAIFASAKPVVGSTTQLAPDTCQ